MKKGRFKARIIGVLPEQEAGSPTAEVCRRHGISEQTFYRWKARYSGMTVSDVQKLRTLEDENPRLKKLLAEAMLDVSAPKDDRLRNLISSAARPHRRRWRSPINPQGSHNDRGNGRGQVTVSMILMAGDLFAAIVSGKQKADR